MRNIAGKSTFKLFLLLLLIFCMLSSQTVFAEAAATQTAATETAAAGTGDQDLAYLRSIMDMIKEKYKGQVTDSQLIEGAVKGMLGSLDPYTTFFTPQEADNFSNSVGGTYTGIGISMEISGGYIMVTKVFPASPAEKAGIIQGDKIAEIDGKSAAGKSSEEVAALIMGDAGTTVDLGILRSGKTDLLQFNITRDIIKISPVTYEIRKNIGYIKLEMFNENTDEYLTNALNEMDKNKVTRIVLDLRGNPGGLVVQAVAAARHFVPRGLITRLDFGSESYTDEKYYSDLEAPKYKLAVLVNEMSASASEIIAGAIQDTGAGKLIGTKTFGKAKVQDMIPILSPEASEKYEKQLGTKFVDVTDLWMKYGIAPLENEIIGYTKMTVGLYYTPKDRMIDGVGITPDITVANPALVSGIDVNSIAKLTGTYKPGLNGEGADVYNAEKILKILGYAVDAPDMKLDSKTFSAIKRFQKNSGFEFQNYGVLNFTTQSALNAALDKMVLKTDLQYAKAVEVLNEK